MIAQGFGFTRDFLKERNNSAYCRLKKIPCGFKEQARARHPGEKCGLVVCNEANHDRAGKTVGAGKLRSPRPVLAALNIILISTGDKNVERRLSRTDK